jgi:glycosyltransferase involved in cell wall biosynthesis
MVNRKQKILFFVPLPPPVTGAGLRNQSLVQSKLLNDSFAIKVVPFNFAKEVDDIGKVSVQKLFKFLERFIVIVYQLIAFRPNIVYFNISLYGFALYRDAAFVFVFKAFRSNLLFHLRTQGVKMQITNSRFKKSLFKFIFRNSKVVCLSNFLTKDIEGVYKETPFVVNNGIEDVNTEIVVRQAGKEANIFFMAHLWKFKGVLELIQAAKVLASESYKYQLIIAGPEGDISITQLRAEVLSMGINNNVKIIGSIDGVKKMEIFKWADIFVLPTHFDAFPGAVVEAMQYNLPVVSTYEGAIPEIVDNRETGLLFEKGNIEQLADQLKELIMNPELRIEMGLKGKSKFDTHYTVDLFENNMKSVFESVIANA